MYSRHIHVRDNFSCSSENLIKILQVHPNPHIVTEIDFNFYYWIPAREIIKFVKQCTNLDKLSVAHSTIGTQELEEILCGNAKISKLSISIHDPESFWQNNKLVDHYLEKTTVSGDDPLALLNLTNCRETLSKLETLELNMGQYPIILTTPSGKLEESKKKKRKKNRTSHCLKVLK